MPLYSMDVKLCATAYVIAENEVEAARLIRSNFTNSTGELPEGYIGDGIEVYGGMYNPDMPEVSISPAVTFIGPDDGDTVDYADDLEEDADDLEEDSE